MYKMGEMSKAIMAVVGLQSIGAGYFLITKLAFDVGMNTFVFTFYRQAAATLFLLPFAIFFERKTAPRLSFSTFVKIFILSLVGFTVGLNVAALGLKYTSSSLAAATSNCLPVITFFLAVLLRMERVKIRSRTGIMKMTGVALCMGGVATIAFYRGPLLQLHHSLMLQSHTIIPPTPTITRIKGVFLLFLSVITWSLWLVLQGRMLKLYPSKLLLTALQCSMSTIQSFVAAIAFARDLNHWKLGWNIRLLSVVYSGVAMTGVNFYVQAWVIEKKGPVFFAMTTPLVMLFTLIISTFILGETVSLGSILGALLLVGGLYFVLWGKSKEEQRAKMECSPNFDVENVSGDSKVEDEKELEEPNGEDKS